MKNWKDKDVIIGLVIIIILGAIALFLLIKREVRYYKETPAVMEETDEDAEFFSEEPEEEMNADAVLTETVTEEIVEEQFTEEDKVEEVKAEEEVTLANVQIVTEETSKQIAAEINEKVSLYDIFGSEKYVAASLTERKQDDDQLKELYEYWEAYKLDAVADLVRLERLQKISKELDGSNKFYYYGSVDRLGRPSGKGLAVYADNTYYFGEWKEGLRNGKGMWLEVAVYTEENKNKNLGVIEHSYSGQWSKDLPNGEGQEHFSYDYDILNEEDMQSYGCIANVIGDFKDGYYHGEMYIMTVDKQGKSKDWSGICKNGVWEPMQKGNTTDAVWETFEKDEQGNAEYYYMYPKDNKNYGIIGLKK